MSPDRWLRASRLPTGYPLAAPPALAARTSDSLDGIEPKTKGRPKAAWSWIRERNRYFDWVLAAAALMVALTGTVMMGLMRSFV